MQQRPLGGRGLKVSEFCLGAMTFGREANSSESDAILEAFVEAGGTFIDTADVYNQGVSEEIVGKWLKSKRRQDFVIATKIRFPMGQAPNDVGLSRQHILDGVENSLRRLQTDYIDLYQVHCWDPTTPLEETLSTLNDLVRQGRVRYIGASNHLPHQLQLAIDTSKREGWEPYCSLQPLYNLLDRYIEWELVELCHREKLAILPWGPLRGGWLSGKYRREDKGPAANTRVKTAEAENWYETWEHYATERTWNILDKVQEIAAARSKTIAQVALNWVKDQPRVTAPILGARNMQQFSDNLGAVGWELSQEEREQLNTVSAMELPYYPYGFVQQANS